MVAETAEFIQVFVCRKPTLSTCGFDQVWFKKNFKSKEISK
jgi:hypothetical protein